MRKLGYFVSGLLCAGSLSANPAADIFLPIPKRSTAMFGEVYPV